MFNDDVQTEEVEIVKRSHSIASKDSSFTFGLSNRLLAPLGIITVLLVTSNIKIIFLFLFVFIYEVVLKYALQLSSKTLFKTIWTAFFTPERKTVKN